MNPPAPIKTPKEISPRVWEALRKIFPDPMPLTVPARPENYSSAGECHRSVAQKIKQDGGSAQFGWVIWEIPPWEIQVEFHSVWKSPEGELVDVTPPLHQGPSVLFLPDPTTVYDGRNIPGLHYPYDDGPLCREYIEIVTEQEKILYPSGELHDGSKGVPLLLLAPLMKRMVVLLMKSMRNN